MTAIRFNAWSEILDFIKKLPTHSKIELQKLLIVDEYGDTHLLPELLAKHDSANINFPRQNGLGHISLVELRANPELGNELIQNEDFADFLYRLAQDRDTSLNFQKLGTICPFRKDQVIVPVITPHGKTGEATDYMIWVQDHDKDLDRITPLRTNQLLPNTVIEDVFKIVYREKSTKLKQLTSLKRKTKNLLSQIEILEEELNSFHLRLEAYKHFYVERKMMRVTSLKDRIEKLEDKATEIREKNNLGLHALTSQSMPADYLSAQFDLINRSASLVKEENLLKRNLESKKNQYLVSIALVVFLIGSLPVIYTGLKELLEPSGDVKKSLSPVLLDSSMYVMTLGALSSISIPLLNNHFERKFEAAIPEFEAKASTLLSALVVLAAKRDFRDIQQDIRYLERYRLPKLLSKIAADKVLQRVDQMLAFLYNPNKPVMISAARNVSDIPQSDLLISLKQRMLMLKAARTNPHDIYSSQLLGFIHQRQLRIHHFEDSMRDHTWHSVALYSLAAAVLTYVIYKSEVIPYSAKLIFLSLCASGILVHLAHSAHKKSDKYLKTAKRSIEDAKAILEYQQLKREYKNIKQDMHRLFANRSTQEILAIQQAKAQLTGPQM